jgi:hypothetical protein
MKEDTKEEKKKLNLFPTTTTRTNPFQSHKNEASVQPSNPPPPITTTSLPTHPTPNYDLSDENSGRWALFIIQCFCCCLQFRFGIGVRLGFEG